MSSIRPLATITLLAAVGIFLYLKINETEPVLPDEVAGFEFDQGLEFGTEFEATPEFGGTTEPSAATSAGGTAPAYIATAPAETAPAFVPGEVAEPVATEATMPGAAPAFVAGAVTVPPVADSTTSGVPDLPEVPTVPSVAEPVAVESVNTPVVENTEAQAVETAPQVVDATPPVESPVTPPTESPVTPPVAEQGALFAATRSAVEAALDRGQLSQALLLLSDWYGDPSLSAQETQEVEQLLSQLAGSVIYSTEHRLEAPYRVQEGEKLQDIAARYQVPWQLLAKINGIQSPEQLQTGQELKVVRGPFSATIDLSKRECTLMLNRRYAGKFAIDVDPTTGVEEGHWAVNQKLVTPSNASQVTPSPVTPTEDHSLILSNTGGDSNQLVIIRGSNVAAGATAGPVGRVIRLSAADVEDVFDILSLGSEVTIRR